MNTDIAFAEWQNRVSLEQLIAAQKERKQDVDRYALLEGYFYDAYHEAIGPPEWMKNA